MAQTSELNSRPPIRLWPGVVAVTLQWLLIFGAPIVAPDLILYGMLGGVSLGLVILLWWLFFSHALVRTHRRRRAYSRCGVRGLAAGSRVHFERNDGDDVARLLHSGHVPGPSGRGGGQSRAAHWTSARGAGRSNRARVFNVNARADRRYQGRRHCRSPLAMDADSRAAAPRTSRQGERSSNSPARSG